MKNKEFFSLNFIVEAGIMLALAIVLDKVVPHYELPNGGSVTLASSLPIIIIAIRWGLSRGLITGLMFGLLQMVLSGHIYHPIQGILDYPLAFVMLGFSALTIRPKDRENVYGFIPFVTLAFVLRFISHTISGIVFFASDPNSIPASTIFSLQYNASYMVPELIITLVLLVLLWKPLNRILKKQY
ncbi:MAG: energy-coupled thiamine transporter ThiT [Tissierellia bacterium]|nr:energy-coupled thiamine transporter ThiT [Tissierellia bacterium]